MAKIVPHKHQLDLNPTHHTVTLLSSEQKKEAKARLKAHNQRDSDKLKTDEARNNYESLIYEFRSWLNDDDNQLWIKPED